MMPVLDHIADIEYSFGKPEWIDPEKFMEGYIGTNEKGWMNFKPIITWNPENNTAKVDMRNPDTGEIILKKGEPINSFFFPKDALERVFKNIVSNAQSHGFTNRNRKDYLLCFSWYSRGNAIIIEIANNGNPIPDDKDTSFLLQYGVSSAMHENGHNGIGCHEIDDIMRRYGGSVKIVSLPNDFYTVKYVLIFERVNTTGTLNF